MVIDSAIDEPVPVNLIFFFRRALKKYLDDLVFGSTELAELLREFFEHLRLSYQIRSDEKLKNINHFYTLDHKMEVENFSKISPI